MREGSIAAGGTTERRLPGCVGTASFKCCVESSHTTLKQTAQAAAEPNRICHSYNRDMYHHSMVPYTKRNAAQLLEKDLQLPLDKQDLTEKKT